MSIQDAMKECGLGYFTLIREAKKGSFEADMPRGRSGGWDINEQSFKCWWLRRRMKTGNAPGRAAARRELAALGGSL
jgi:hypothetical protein